MDTLAFMAMLRARPLESLNDEERRVLDMSDALNAKRAQVAGWLLEFIREHPDDWQNPFKHEGE